MGEKCLQTCSGLKSLHAAWRATGTNRENEMCNKETEMVFAAAGLLKKGTKADLNQGDRNVFGQSEHFHQ